MLQASTLKFLRELKKNNQRDWFEVNRKRYEAAKADIENFTGQVLQNLARKDESISHLTPKECTFRINRDVRFSKDKSPYKTNMAMYISKGGKKIMNAGYYFHCEPGSAFLAGGVWMPMAPELKKIRQEIDYNWDEFNKLLQAKKFKSAFGELERTPEVLLTRPPKGYDENNPAIDYLKLKSFIASAKLSDEELLEKDLVKKVVTRFETMKPFIDFLNRALEH
jgi:uncharacterized protein (TIGR02453 family)